MIQPVILCGGSGTRLWPLSRSTYPKQFVNFDANSSLFSKTFQRASHISNEPPFVICNKDHRLYVQANIKEQKSNALIIVEPLAKNTCPAITIAALAALDKDKEAILAVFPSDHLIKDEEKFIDFLKESIEIAKLDYLVTLGIVPEYPETGFGYIKKGNKLTDNSFQVSKFVEKPNEFTAKKIFAEGSYLWNSGIFIFKASIFLQELKQYDQILYEYCAKAWLDRTVKDDFCFLGKEAFSKLPSISIDYAVMEKTKLAATVQSNFKWSDLGSWKSFFETGEKDQSNNVYNGNVLLKDTKNSYIFSSGRLVTALGINNLAIVETKDSVLVLPLERSQEVKALVEDVKKINLELVEKNPLVFRPWGSYEGLARGDRFQVKRIIVQPNEQLSLQKHHHRAEHWIVVQGTASVTIGSIEKIITENQSIYIPVGETHRLANPGKIPLIVIEVQSGSYLGEDDIVRLEDKYDRI